MAKGIVAFMIVVALTLAMSIMSGLGFYAALNVDYQDAENQDVQKAADALVGQEASNQAGGSVLEDFTSSSARTLATGWQVIANLGGILQLLLGVPDVLANALQTFWQLTYGITFAAFLRGVVLQ